MRARTMIAVVVVSLATLAAATVTQAGPPGHADRRLHRLAYEVEKSSHNVHKHAERHAYRWSYGEERALRRLHELNRSARVFRKTLERYGPYRGRTEAAFFQLNDAAWSARRALPGTHAFHKTHREFRRLDYLVQQLRQEYRVRLAHARPGPPRHGYGKPPRHDAYLRIDARTARGHATFRHVWDD